MGLPHSLIRPRHPKRTLIALLLVVVGLIPARAAETATSMWMWQYGNADVGSHRFFGTDPIELANQFCKVMNSCVVTKDPRCNRSWFPFGPPAIDGYYDSLGDPPYPIYRFECTKRSDVPYAFGGFIAYQPVNPSIHPPVNPHSKDQDKGLGMSRLEREPLIRGLSVLLVLMTCAGFLLRALLSSRLRRLHPSVTTTVGQIRFVHSAAWREIGDRSLATLCRGIRLFDYLYLVLIAVLLAAAFQGVLGAYAL